MAKGFQDCTVIRHMRITEGTFDMATGKTAQGVTVWVTRPCRTPLFSEEERKTGECRSCRNGWTRPDNYRITPAMQLFIPNFPRDGRRPVILKAPIPGDAERWVCWDETNKKEIVVAQRHFNLTEDSP